MPESVTSGGGRRAMARVLPWFTKASILTAVAERTPVTPPASAGDMEMRTAMIATTRFMGRG